MLAMVLFAGVRGRIETSSIPKSLQGLPITLVSASLVACSFLGSSGTCRRIIWIIRRGLNDRSNYCCCDRPHRRSDSVGASIVFAVPVDEKQVAVRECLPGANCGACGYSGCDGYAAALANGEAQNGLCAPGGTDAAEAIAEVLGVALSVQWRKK